MPYTPGIWYRPLGARGNTYKPVEDLKDLIIGAEVIDVGMYGTELTLRTRDGRIFNWITSGYEYEMEVEELELPEHST